ncbi:MAG: DUF1572 family protein [Mameliella sp.]|nr:DUF1572 family protein [Phaeodactylibacter sp.]
MEASINSNFLSNTIGLFKYYKQLGEKAMAQTPEEGLFQVPYPDQNSIAIIVKHMHGNMLSRWTNFLTEDGEKPWREREEEFNPTLNDRENIMQAWEEGWACLLNTLNELRPDQLENIIYIRNEGHTALEAIQRQLGHYSYHVGQIVFLAKSIVGPNWSSLSIAKGASSSFNEEKFNKSKSRKRFYE